MVLIDWGIVGLYISAVVLMSYLVGKSQKNHDDYYLGGRVIPAWQAGASMTANQVSAISLVGAPAFIALKKGGGLVWLQYEMAIPLAMIAIIIFVMPLVRSVKGITIYEYLEKRFGYHTRLTMSLVFLISRSLATGVALLATAYVTSVCMGIPLTLTIIIIGAVSLLYTSMGGIKADIYSDIMQLAVLWISSFVLIGILIVFLEPSGLHTLANERFRIFDCTATGLGDGNSFAFLPMLVGGLFLYISYYGCDQSQAQRLLTAKNDRIAARSLLINSLLRFPLVLTYCCAGILMVPFMASHASFAEVVNGLPADYLMPVFFRDYVPAGMRGLLVAGIFAASMSSLDSAINSLSAATWEDIIIPLRPHLAETGDRAKIFIARLMTVCWGVFTILCALWFSGGTDTVIEMVNKIGSAFYGPVAGVFILGILSRKAGQGSALTGLASGVFLNIALWMFFHDSISWMWWNCTGFFTTVLTGVAVAFIIPQSHDKARQETPRVFGRSDYSFLKKYSLILVGWFAVIIIISLCIEHALT